jgi:hypothetical protein
MKKILAILGILLFINMVVMSLSKAFAYAYDNDFKTAFYDSFEVGMFEGLEQSLLSQGFTKLSVGTYIATLKAKFNRTSLEQASWDCVSKYTVQQMQTPGVVDKCFESWSNNFFFVENSKALGILKK